MSKPLLEVSGLKAGYGLAEVLYGIDLVLRPSEVVALIGRNGAGKSTTLKAIMGLVHRDATILSFKDEDIRRLPAFRIARLGLGYVPEERRIFTDLTVEENLEVGRREGRARHNVWTLERLFSIFPNLSGLLGRRASAMSGGEQQMLTIARTLMGNPEAVLLDEPSEGLAPVIVEQMARAVIAMKREGVAVLLSEQNAQFAAAVSDRAYIIETGVVRYSGPMTELEADPTIRNAYLGL